jgi:cysteine desulfurase
MKRVYLDHNAASQPVSAAIKALHAVAASGWANPASAHREGQRARAHLEQAREQVAALAGVPSTSIFFTSGGTEAAHAALHGAALAGDCRRVVISALEHPALRAAAASLTGARRELVVVPPGVDGVVDAERFLAACDEQGTVAALILAHNETGILQPVSEIASALRQRDIPFIVDTVQAPGRLPDFMPDGAHVIGMLSAQKMGGLPGAGAVIVPADRPLVPFLAGGEQERRRRGGTPAVALIAAMGAAAESLACAAPESWYNVARLRDRFEEGLLAGSHEVEVLGRQQERLPNTCTFLAHGVIGEDMVAALDLDGVAVSSGSACSTGSSTPSDSLLAMGYSPAQARSMVRVSLGLETVQEEIDQALASTLQSLSRLQRHAAAGAGG